MKLFTKTMLLCLGALSFFSCSEDDAIKNLTPSSPTIFYPLNSSKDVVSEVVLKWKASADPEKSSIKYDVYVSTVEKLTDADILSKDQLQTTFEVALSGHTTYFWKVMAKNERGGKSESDICSFTTANRIPKAASNLFPKDKADNLPRALTLKWDASIDSDKDAFTYTLYVGKNETFTDNDIKEKNTSKTEYSADFERLTKYFWKVVTKDSQGGINSSAVHSFTIGNNLPSMPEIIFPLNKALNIKKISKLKWTKSIDPDGDQVKYNVLLGKTEDLKPSDKYNKDALVANELAITLEGHTKYFWKIEVLDINVSAFESSLASFTTLNEIPTIPIVKELEDVEVGDLLTLPISWSASVDGDNDELKYDVYLSDNNDFDESDRIAQDITSTTYTIPAIAYNTNYKLKVVCKDGFGGQTSSATKTLTSKPLKAVIERKSFKITSPIIDFKGLPVFVKWESAGKGVKYDLFISKKSDFSTLLFSKENLSNLVSNIFLENLEENTKLYVKITAKDDFNNTLDSDAFTFVYKKFGEYIDSRDNKVYKTVNINGQVWLAENFAYIPYVLSSRDDRKKCCVYGSNIDKGFSVADLKENPNYNKYGVMYSWYMLEDVIPDGWHVATEEDWKTVELANGIKESDLGIKSFRGGSAAKFKSKEGWDPTGSDIIGLNILPGGCWELGDKKLGERIYLWTGTEDASSSSKLTAWYRALAKEENGVYRNKTFKSQRYYMRLVKNN